MVKLELNMAVIAATKRLLENNILTICVQDIWYIGRILESETLDEAVINTFTENEIRFFMKQHPKFFTPDPLSPDKYYLNGILHNEDIVKQMIAQFNPSFGFSFKLLKAMNILNYVVREEG